MNDAVYQLQDREVSRRVTLKQLDKAGAQLRAANVSMGLEAEGVQGEDFDMAVTAASSYSEAVKGSPRPQ